MATNFPIEPKCGVINCGKPQVAKGLCETHYKRLQRHGTVSDEVGKKTIEGMLLSRHPLYETWRNLTRTNAGKSVCDAWRDFTTFVKDAGDKPEMAFALKRIDSSKLFEPGNVRWMMRTASGEKRKTVAEYQRDLRSNNPTYSKDKTLRKYYGITLDDYNKMLESQNGVCAICNQPEKRVDKRLNRTSDLAVDHCHDTGKVRGLLCHACNAALGQVNDSVETLERAIAYLRLHHPSN